MTSGAVTPKSRILGTGRYTPEKVVPHADLERPRGTVDHGPLGDAREAGEALGQMTSLPTISPFTTCRSTISSMSARST